MPVFLSAGDADPEGYFPLRASDLRHLRTVLRQRPGETFTVILPDGRRAEARLEGRGPNSRGRVTRFLEVVAAASLPLWLGIGILRWNRLEWLVEKATELGVEAITLLPLRHGRLGKGDIISPNKINRLKKIAQETLKQCESIASPRIVGPLGLPEFLRSLDEAASVDTQRLLLQERSSAPLLGTVLRSAQHYVLLIGPEGGFHPEELAAARVAGFNAVSLGPQVLRSETAALYAASALDSFRRSREAKP